MPTIDLLETRGRTWYRGNLHLHSNLSDGVAPPDEVISTYRDVGYDFIALTDHYEAEYGWQIVDTTGYRTDSFTTLLAAEFSTGHWDARETVWVNAVGLPEGFAGTDPEDHLKTLQEARATGAHLTLLHPGLNAQPAQTVIHSGLAELLDAVEIYNHNCATGGLSDAAFGTYMAEALLEAGYRIDLMAGDDAHFGHPMDRFGGWVEVASPDLSPESLMASLKSGNYYATQGPEIHALQRNSNVLTVETSPVYNIVVAACGDRWQQSVAHEDQTGDGVTTAAVDLTPFTGSWCRVILVDHNLRRAWSNPIWV